MIKEKQHNTGTKTGMWISRMEQRMQNQAQSALTKGPKTHFARKIAS